MIPQILIILIGFYGIGNNIVKHGQPKNPKLSIYHGWAKALAVLILWAILYFGGFWDVLINSF
jgi:hypothetical protein